MPAKRIIILDKVGPKSYQVALWVDVPAARQAFYSNVSAKSSWSGASGADNTAIQNGTVNEQVIIYTVNGTLAAAQSDLQAIWNRAQSDINGANPWNFYGTIWDGTIWTIGGAA